MAKKRVCPTAMCNGEIPKGKDTCPKCNVSWSEEMIAHYNSEPEYVTKAKKEETAENGEKATA